MGTYDFIGLADNVDSKIQSQTINKTLEGKRMLKQYIPGATSITTHQQVLLFLSSSQFLLAMYPETTHLLLFNGEESMDSDTV